MRIALLSLVLCANVFAISPESDDIVLPKLRKALKGQPELNLRSVKKAGNRTIEFESMLSQEGDLKYAPTILGNFPEYGKWALRNINKRPGGGDYYLKINSLSTDPKDDHVLISDTLLTLPIFSKEIKRAFKMRYETKGDIFTLVGEALSNDQSLIESASGYLRIYPAEGLPGHVWIYVHGASVLRNWFVYEAIPDKLMTNEAGERIQIVLDNYLAEEERLRQLKLLVKPSQSPTGKTAAQGAPAASPIQK